MLLCGFCATNLSTEHVSLYVGFWTLNIIIIIIININYTLTNMRPGATKGILRRENENLFFDVFCLITPHW